MQMKKVLAGTLAALTAGATLAMGAFAIDSLGDYVVPGDGSLTSPIVVIGAPAAPSSDYAKDVIGAANIAAAVAGYATTSVTSTTATTTVSGGSDIATADNKLYFKSQMNKAKSTLTSNDLSTLLATNTATVDLSGTFTYNQYINIGSRITAFGKSGGDLDDPALHINIGTNAETAPLYNATITFNKPLNVSHADVQGGTMTMFGVDYTIGSGSRSIGTSGSNLILELFGGANILTISEGEEQTVTVGGTEYTIGILGVSTATGAVVTVNGQSKSVASTTSYTISGLDVYVKEIYFLSKETQVSSVKLVLGSSKITIQDGAKVKTGTALNNIDGTRVKIAGGTAGISKITIGVAAEESQVDHIAVGSDGAFVDPVFGTFKVALNGLTPAIGSTARESIVIDNAGNTGATVKFTDYRGNEKTLTWARTLTGSNFAPMLNQSATRKYVVIEGQTVKENDYVLLAPSQESEFGHIFQLSDVSDIGSTNPSFTLTDAMSGDTVQSYIDTTGGTMGSRTFYVDGQAYCAVNKSTASIAFYWGGGVTCTKDADAGTKTTLFPLIKTKNGAYITLVDNRTALVRGTTYEAPGNSALNITKLELTVGDASVETANQISYGFTNATSATAVNLMNITDSAGTSMINAFPAILVMQEKDNQTTKDFITTDLTISDATNQYAKVDTPALTGNSDTASLGSDTSVSQYLNVYGTFVEYDSDNQGVATISYPDTQSVVTIGVGTNPTFATSGGVTTETAMKITSPVAKLASEVSSTAPGADLILVGGPCANSLTAAVLGADEQCDTWAYTTGIIKEVTDGFDDSSRALVVAGNTADDTRALAAKVIAGTLCESDGVAC